MPIKDDKRDDDKTPRCAINGGYQPCKVENMISNELIFIKIENKHMGCPYAVSFGGTHLCNWPKRYELYLDSKV